MAAKGTGATATQVPGPGDAVWRSNRAAEILDRMVSTLVETRYGKLAGKQVDRVIQWRGIPFAAPPVGARRFLPPAPSSGWTGVRDASHFGPVSLQPRSPMEAVFGASTGEASEDCLYLNVFAPAAEGTGRPVMVWIHGGAFVGGSGSTPWYDGSTFATHGDVVVVTLNYRLGLLGFLHLADAGGERYATSGNCGVADQVAALEWVRDNIEAFGGDPRRVTVFGESAGAMSIGVLLAMPAASGLFQAAILQSGSTSAHHTRDDAAKVTAAVLGHLGTRPDQLVEIPASKLIEAQVAVARGSETADSLPFQPVVDRVSLLSPPGQAIAAGSAAGVRVLIGSNHDEMTLFLAFQPAFAKLDEDGLLRRASTLVGEAAAQHLVAGYRVSRPSAPPGDRLEALMTDMVFRIPAIRLAEAQASHATPVWMYRFDWRTPAFGGALKATHALEIPFVWNIIAKTGVELFTGAGPGRHDLADRMHSAWLAFATSGDPSTPLLGEWPSYEAGRRATMLFDDTCRSAEDPAADERLRWESIL